MEPVKIYTVKRKIVRADGTIRYREEKIKYTPRKKVINVIPDETVRQIVEQFKLGVSKTILKNRFNLSQGELKKIIEVI